MKRLLTIGHSYVVATNRRLAHEMAVQGAGEWSVTAVAPRRFRGDLRRIAAEPIPGEASMLSTLPVSCDRFPHLMFYGAGLAGVLDRPWDVIHCWEEPYVLAAAQIARRARRPARFVVATFQNIDKRYPWPLSATERYTMARADGWIAFGHTVREALGDRAAYATTPSSVIPPGVDVQLFRPDARAGEGIRARLGWHGGDRVVGYLGRFVEQKGIRLLLDALHHCSSDWRALFVGGGPLEPVLRAFAARFPGRVHVETGVSHDEVPAWLNAMTVLCAPSLTTRAWREQFGRMLIEAMACGVPVLASDSGEMPSVVGDAGAVVSESDVAAWTWTIDRVLGDDATLRDYAGRGLERAHTRFAWPVVARAHLAFFDTLREGAPV
jgi:glycosyltransferase involved in cell wall biosynthesis